MRQRGNSLFLRAVSSGGWLLQNPGYGREQSLHFEWFFNQVGLWGEMQRVIDFTRGGCRKKYQGQQTCMLVVLEQFEYLEAADVGKVEIEDQQFDRQHRFFTVGFAGRQMMGQVH